MKIQLSNRPRVTKPSQPPIIRLVVPCHLLKLPRELRDMIYEYALIEPKRWDKRHVPVCPFYGLRGAEEILPCRVMEYQQREDDPARDQDYKTSRDIERCRHLCLKRKGMALLRVNKQINFEASCAFWAYNDFCFDDYQVFIDTFSAIPKKALTSIRGLSLRKTPEHPRPWSGSLVFRKILFANGLRVRDILAQMTSLVGLELSVEWVDALGCQYVGLKNLQWIECVAMKRLAYNSRTVGVLRTIDVGLRSRVYVPLCKPCCEKSDRWICGHCYHFFDDIVKELTALDSAESHKRLPWEFEVQQKLERGDSGRAESEPSHLPLKMLDGTRKVVDIWGLPDPDLYDPVRYGSRAVRRLARRTASDARKALQETIAKQRMSIPRTVFDEEEGEILIPHLRGKRNYKRLEEQKIRGKEMVLQQKKEAKEEELRHERARRKSEQKEAANVRKKAEIETQAERKAARKRSGRRWPGMFVDEEC